MPGPFEIATRAAIDEILKKHVTESKFGYFLDTDSYEKVSDEFYQFLLTSRALKDAGDRMLAGGVPRGRAARKRPEGPGSLPKTS